VVRSGDGATAGVSPIVVLSGDWAGQSSFFLLRAAALRYAVEERIPTAFRNDQQQEGSGMSMKRMVVAMGLVLAASAAGAAEAKAA